jgi:hypothetical protein
VFSRGRRTQFAHKETVGASLTIRACAAVLSLAWSSALLPSCGSNCVTSAEGCGTDLSSWCGGGAGCTVNGMDFNDQGCANPAGDGGTSCAPWFTDTGEAIDIPVGSLWATLPAGADDLNITYLTYQGAGGTGGGTPSLTDVHVMLDGEPAAGCSFSPGTVSCPGISSSVQQLAFSFAYDGAQGEIRIVMTVGSGEGCQVCAD